MIRRTESSGNVNFQEQNNSDADSDAVDGGPGDGTIGGTFGAGNLALFVWSRRATKPPALAFSGRPGINVDIGDIDDPFSYFELFFDEELIDFIVQETNRYANDHIRKHKYQFEVALVGSDDNKDKIAPATSTLMGS